MDYYNNSALLEIEDLKVEREAARRLEKSGNFRKGLWNAVTSPWQTTKKIANGAFSLMENLFSSSARKQKALAARPQAQIDRINDKYDRDALDLNSDSHINYLFIKKNGRSANDQEFDELRKTEKTLIDRKREIEISAWKHGGQERQENDFKIEKTIAGSGYLKFKKWLNTPMPSWKEFNRTEVTWNNLKAFVTGNQSKYTYPNSKIVREVAAAYNEENTYSGVVTPIKQVTPKVAKKPQEKSKFGIWTQRVAVAGMAGVLSLLAVLGFYNKKNQKTENANTYNQAAMVVDNPVVENANKSIEVSETKKTEESGNDSLENAGQSPAPKVAVVANKKVASHSNVGSQRRMEKPVARPVVKEQKIDDSKADEEKRLKIAQELLQEVEEMKLKETWKNRIANLKAKMINPGYIQPTVPTGFSPYDNGMITSTNVVGIPKADSYESHIAIVEEIIAKDNLTAEDAEKAEKALSSSENRMANNILAENQARYINAFDIHMTTARAKLEGLRQRAVQQLLRQETDNENLYVIKYANGKKGLVDLNKLAIEIENLPTKANFQNNAWGEWSCAYAKWFTDNKIPTAK